MNQFKKVMQKHEWTEQAINFLLQLSPIDQFDILKIATAVSCVDVVVGDKIHLIKPNEYKVMDKLEYRRNYDKQEIADYFCVDVSCIREWDQYLHEVTVF